MTDHQGFLRKDLPSQSKGYEGILQKDMREIEKELQNHKIDNNKQTSKT